MDAALAEVGLSPAVAAARAGQLSGGQCQRVALARATIIPPRLLLCDEPTSALDATLAATVLNLIARLRREHGMAVLFVTHDLAVAATVADRVAVMYLGRIVELGPVDDVVHRPRHPYTRALLAALPELGAPLTGLAGEPASPLRPPPGCAFHPRCPVALPECADPALVPLLVRAVHDRAASRALAACIHPEVRRWPSPNLWHCRATGSAACGQLVVRPGTAGSRRHCCPWPR
ncbi:oligopeptide/dipeptide ABC transporter ATP-binding protein [Luedemannella flava]